MIKHTDKSAKEEIDNAIELIVIMAQKMATHPPGSDGYRASDETNVRAAWDTYAFLCHKHNIKMIHG